MPGSMWAKVGGTWGQVFPPLPPAPSYNDATGGTVTEFDEVIARTKVVGAQFTSGTDGFTTSQNGTSTASDGRLVVTKTSAVGGGACASMLEFDSAPDRSYTLSAWVDIPAGALVTMNLVPLDAASQAISGTSNQVSQPGPFTGRMHTSMPLSPSGTARVRIRLTNANQNEPGTVIRFDDVLVETGVVADPVWFDGASTLSPTGRRMRAHTFTADDTLSVTKSEQPFSVLVVGGGGGGRAQDADGGAAAGQGSTGIDRTDVVIPVGDHAVSVGGGGAPSAPYVYPSPGNPSSFLDLVAQGGREAPNGGGWNHQSSITGTDSPYGYGGGIGDQNTGPVTGAGPGAGGGACNGPGGHCGGSAGNGGVVIVAYRIG